MNVPDFTTRIMALLIFFLVAGPARGRAQEIRLVEMQTDFLHNRTFDANGECLMRKRKHVQHTSQLTALKRQRIKWKARRSFYGDEDALVTVYIDTRGIYGDGPRSLYVVWGMDKWWEKKP
jgi:lactam utilization protein B